jgi:hypothetical protein
MVQSGPEYGPMTGTFEYCNRPLHYRKCWEFLQWLSNCLLLTKNLYSIELVILAGLKLTAWKVQEHSFKKSVRLDGDKILMEERKLHDEELHNLFSTHNIWEWLDQAMLQKGKR